MDNSFYLNRIELVNSSIARLENEMEKLENSSGMPQSFLENYWYYQQCMLHTNAYRNYLRNLQRIVDEMSAMPIANSE